MQPSNKDKLGELRVYLRGRRASLKEAYQDASVDTMSRRYLAAREALGEIEAIQRMMFPEEL